MIYVKAPLRITLGGGGTDLPWWYKENGGYVISSSINKYIHVIGNQRIFDKKIQLSYSKNEVINSVAQVKNEILKECLKEFKIKNSIELHTMSDVPGNSGLGSSGSFISAINYFLSIYKGKKLNKYEIANLSCKIEMINLSKNCGKQDQFISTFGGIKELVISKSGKVKVKNINVNRNALRKIKNSMVTFYTGQTRSSETILKSQKINYQNTKKQIQEIMKQIHEIGYKTKKYLINADIAGLGSLCKNHWDLKKKLSPIMSNSKINIIYEHGINNGAEGGKVLGAGGGGYVIFYVKEKNKNKLIKSFKKFNLPQLHWDFEYKGVCQVSDKI